MKIVAYNRDKNYDDVCAELMALDPLAEAERAARLRNRLANMQALEPPLEYRGIEAMAEQLKKDGCMIGDVRESHGLREHVQPHTRAREK